MIRLITYSAIVMFAVGAAILYFFFDYNLPAGLLALSTAVFAGVLYHSLEWNEELCRRLRMYKESNEKLWKDNISFFVDSLAGDKGDGTPAIKKDSEKNPHPNKEEVEKGVAEGRGWQWRKNGNIRWLDPTQPFGPTWNEEHEYRLVPVEEPPSKSEPNPHPNRSEVEAGIAAGRTWEWKFRTESEQAWTRTTQRIPNWFVTCDYRLTPEPEYVPLGPEDVPPGSEFKRPTYSKGTGVAISGHNEKGFWYMNASAELCFVAYAEAMEYYGRINRSLPLTGKWDANAWEPCRKLKS